MTHVSQLLWRKKDRGTISSMWKLNMQDPTTLLWSLFKSWWQTEIYFNAWIQHQLERLSCWGSEKDWHVSWEICIEFYSLTCSRKLNICKRLRQLRYENIWFSYKKPNELAIGLSVVNGNENKCRRKIHWFSGPYVDPTLWAGRLEGGACIRSRLAQMRMGQNRLTPKTTSKWITG